MPDVPPPEPPSREPDSAARGPFRIALVAPASAVHTARWANALAQRGHEIHLFSLHPPRHPFDAGVRIHPLPGPPALGYFAASRRLRRELATLRPDVVNAHYASGYGTLARRCGRGPLALSVWGSDVFDFPRRSPWHRLLLVRNLRAADRVFSTSRAMAEAVERLAPGIPSPRLTPFGVDTEHFRPIPAPASDRLTVGTVKTLAPTYGIDRLIHAFAGLVYHLQQGQPELAERLELRIGGDGPDRQSLERLARDLDVAERVTFRGAIPHEEVPRYLAGIDVFAALSRSESFGVAVLEASACGVPVVATDVGGLPEVVADGETGRLVPDGDSEAVVDTLMALVRDAELRERMGRAGREWVSTHYEWSHCLANMEAAYSDVVREAAGAGRAT